LHAYHNDPEEDDAASYLEAEPLTGETLGALAEDARPITDDDWVPSARSLPRNASSTPPVAAACAGVGRP
jgi:hypothetical protein